MSSLTRGTSALVRGDEVDTVATATISTQTSTSSSTQRKRNETSKVTWGDLPRKDQLIAITLTRLSEPLAQTSLQSYMFYQLKWFDPNLEDAVIARQAGILQASFAAAQCLTGMMWGRIADSRYFGRKTVLLIGLSGTSEVFFVRLMIRSQSNVSD